MTGAELGAIGVTLAAMLGIALAMAALAWIVLRLVPWLLDASAFGKVEQEGEDAPSLDAVDRAWIARRTGRSPAARPRRSVRR